MKPVLSPLPESLQRLFWDVDFSTLDWENDRDWIVRRVLQAGSWSDLRWLRSSLGDEALRRWIEVHAGRGLSPRQLRYWELVLDIPAREVDQWVSTVKDSIWERRVQR